MQFQKKMSAIALQCQKTKNNKQNKKKSVAHDRWVRARGDLVWV